MTHKELLEVKKILQMIKDPDGRILSAISYIDRDIAWRIRQKEQGKENRRDSYESGLW